MRKRVSRSLWDKARNPNTPNRPLAIFKAILYELQPVDFMHSRGGFQIHEICKTIKTSSHEFVYQVKNITPTVVRVIRETPFRHWMIPSIFFIYWKLVVYLHEKLDAGPVVLIITVLVIIFTVGLGDSSKNSAGGNVNGQERMSAYSVFNRGFRSILGGVDANALLNQHIGGGLMAGANVPRDADVDNGDVRHRRRPIIRPEQQPPEPPQPQPQQQGGNIETSRKSNKKNRRKKNIELRREMQRQRDAAIAMGFVGGGDRDDDWQNNRDQMAMNRLVEDEIQPAVAMQHGQQHE